MKCDCTRAETRFRLSSKRTSPFKSARASVHSTTGSRGVRISGRNAGYTMFRGNVKVTGYPFHSPVSPSLPLQCVTVCHHIATGVYSGGVVLFCRPLILRMCSLTLLYLYRARNEITQFSIPTHAQLQRHRLKLIKNHLKTPTCFGLRPSSVSYNVLAKITII